MTRIALPAGEIMHDHLISAFVDLLALIADLTQSKFSGYVALRSGERAGLILLHCGIVCDVFYGPTDKNIDSAVIERILSVVRDPGTEISVRRLSGELMTGLIAWLHGETLHNNLNAQAIKLDGLLKSLAENQFSGCIDIRLPDNETEGIIFLSAGESAGSFYRAERELVLDVDRVKCMFDEPRALVTVLASPADTIRTPIAARALTSPELELLIEATQRCLLALGELAGKSMAQSNLESARQAALAKHPWLSGLRLDEGKVSGKGINLLNVTVHEAIGGFLAVLNDCWEQGISLFGERAIRTSIQKNLSDLRSQLDALGFPKEWP